jgi:hypothetical protein
MFSEFGTVALKGSPIQDFYSHGAQAKWTSTLSVAAHVKPRKSGPTKF